MINPSSYLFMLRGVQGSGKTTLAKAMVKYLDAARVSRDDVRMMLFNRQFNQADTQAARAVVEATVRRRDPRGSRRNSRPAYRQTRTVAQRAGTARWR